MELGETFAMLDDSLGWAWGYAGEERRVGYVQSAALDQETTERSQIS
jgi:Bacterial dipeptidyl-peptidase Sh3 domain